MVISGMIKGVGVTAIDQIEWTAIRERYIFAPQLK
jgi:hypothetical protein